MAICSNCSNVMSDEAAFCSNCGQAMTAPLQGTDREEAAQQSGQTYGQRDAARQDYQQQGQATQPPTNPYGYGQAPPNQFGYPPAAQPYPSMYGQAPMVAPKDKAVAILLAVFLSFWTWLYTYQRDAKKFWWGLGIAVGGIILGFLLIIPMLAPFGVWIWAIVDTASKPQEYYLRFPAG